MYSVSWLQAQAPESKAELQPGIWGQPVLQKDFDGKTTPKTK